MTCLPSGSSIPREFFGLRSRNGLERRFVLVAVPDISVVARFAPRADRQDDDIEQEFPQQRIVFDDAAVAQELFQIAPHRRRRRCIGGAEIDQKDADTGCLLRNHARRAGRNAGLRCRAVTRGYCRERRRLSHRNRLGDWRCCGLIVRSSALTHYGRHCAGQFGNRFGVWRGAVHRTNLPCPRRQRRAIAITMHN